MRLPLLLSPVLLTVVVAWAAGAQAPAIAKDDSLGWRLSLPPAYAQALAARGVTPTTLLNHREGGDVTRTASPGAVILPGAVVLAGVTRDSVLVVLLRQTGGRVTVQQLAGQAWESDAGMPEMREIVRTPDGTGPRVGRMLSVQRQGGATWVRWQDGDCKERGTEWRLTPTGALAQTRRSRCVYGE